FRPSTPRALPVLAPFPTRRSSDLRQSRPACPTGPRRDRPGCGDGEGDDAQGGREMGALSVAGLPAEAGEKLMQAQPAKVDRWLEDRKSTRLNSSHVSISYAVFCLK